MRVDTALLCDVATVRDGLLFIIGGGITRVYRPAYPAQLGCQLAVRIMLHPTEADAQHDMRIVLMKEDGETIAEVNAKFGVQPESAKDMPPGEELSLALVLPVQGVPIPALGGYSFELLVDGIHQLSLPFRAEPPQT